jgi:hypothetical protein
VFIAEIGVVRTTCTAKRVRHSTEQKLDVVLMMIVTCVDCGNQFAIGHPPEIQDAELARRQANWLKDQFVWDHIQEQKHRASIRLPASNESIK